MTRRAAVTCDQCGTMQDTPAGDAAFGILPRGWISAAYDPPLDAPQPQVKQHADLCSWLCAAAYAAERAGMALAPLDLEAGTRFMPAEALIVRAGDAPWERLARGQRVTITLPGSASAEMKVTDTITHVDGAETYVLDDVAVTGAELAERRRAQAAMFASLAACGTCSPDAGGAAHDQAGR